MALKVALLLATVLLLNVPESEQQQYHCSSDDYYFDGEVYDSCKEKFSDLNNRDIDWCWFNTADSTLVSGREVLGVTHFCDIAACGYDYHGFRQCPSKGISPGDHPDYDPNRDHPLGSVIPPGFSGKVGSWLFKFGSTEYMWFKEAFRFIDKALSTNYLRRFEAEALRIARWAVRGEAAWGRLNWANVLGELEGASYEKAMAWVFRTLKDLASESVLNRGLVSDLLKGAWKVVKDRLNKITRDEAHRALYELWKSAAEELGEVIEAARGGAFLEALEAEFWTFVESEFVWEALEVLILLAL